MIEYYQISENPDMKCSFVHTTSCQGICRNDNRIKNEVWQILELSITYRFKNNKVGFIFFEEYCSTITVNMQNASIYINILKVN